MSLYSKYLHEREGFECIENEYSFATFMCAGQECYLRDLYVLPEKRNAKAASQIADQVCEVARGKGCKFLIGSVSPKDPHATENIQILVKYGMKFLKNTPDLLFFSKSL